MIHVHFTDGTSESFEDIVDAECGLEESVIGCDFATMVDSITDDQGNSYGCTWSVKVVKL